jgi:hypothetical protein
MSINAGTGLISGAAAEAGVWQVGVIVTDSTNGTSAQIMFPIGIEPAAGSAHTGEDLIVELQTGKVTSATATAATVNAAEELPVVIAKEGDRQLLYVQFQRSGTIINYGDLTRHEFRLKKRDSDDTLVIGGGVGNETPPLQIASGPWYILSVYFDPAVLADALDEEQDDSGTFFVGLGELSWDHANTSGCGPATLTRTSQTFKVKVAKNLSA